MADTFLTILGNYVFPIVACCVMAYFVKYMYDQTNSRVDKLNEQHKNEVDTLRQFISQSIPQLMNTLIERLEK